MLSRRMLGKAVAAVTAGQMPRRPDQYYQPGQGALGAGTRAGILRARTVIIQGAGGGEFIYDSNGKLREAGVGANTTDPIQGIACKAGRSFFNAFGAVLVLISDSNDAIFQYNDTGSAVQGTLVLAGATSAGTDPILGTAYSAGQNIIDPVVASSLLTLGALVKFGQLLYTQNGQIGASQGGGAASPALTLHAPEQGTSGHLAMSMQGKSPDGTGPAQLRIASVPTGTSFPNSVTAALLEHQGTLALVNAVLPGFVSTAWQQAAVNGVLNAVTGSGGLSGAVPLTQTDATTFTVTATGANQASKAWSIPAKDANALTLYRLTVWGIGTEGTTAQNLLVGLSLNGANTRTVSAAALPISAPFRFKIRMELLVNTTGAGGTAELAGDGMWSSTATPTVSSVFAAGSAAAGQEAFDTTVANTLRLNLGWASVTGAPTITTLGSLFERLGP